MPWEGHSIVRAIDLYAGIGGWSLGLKLAGIEVVASYEWWQPAIDTHNANLGGSLKPVDIRKLCLADLPTDIDLVVGSPPCTEFSYANRGGNGNIAEGLKDLVKFFEIVTHLKPRFWAMENVPRVQQVILSGMQDPEHALYRYRGLKPNVEIFDFAEYGAPQARKRCIATNLPLEALQAFKTHTPVCTLGDVVQALAGTEEIKDPVWGTRLPGWYVTECQTETPLNREELRMNREAKEHHPIYNNMAFPDPLDRPARTVTATCTRVSRESIVISNPKRPSEYRRLTIRERACLQGFPITYQFFAKSFAEKAKMIGNAVPPTFTHLIGLTAKGMPAFNFEGFDSLASSLSLPEQIAPVTLPDREGRTYPSSRAFRAAVPGFRFKSGMRFELSNAIIDDLPEWSVRFFFGSSKDIRQIELDGSVTRDLKRNAWLNDLLSGLRGDFARTRSFLTGTTPKSLQSSWTKRAGGLGPYEVIDKLAELAEELHSRMEAELDSAGIRTVATYVLAVANSNDSKPLGRAKLEKYALRVLAGILVGEWFNTLDWHCERKVAA